MMRGINAWGAKDGAMRCFGGRIAEILTSVGFTSFVNWLVRCIADAELFVDSG